MQYAEELLCAEPAVLKLPLSQEELASMVGVSRGHFSKLMQDFRHEQILGKSRPGEVMINSLARLRAIMRDMPSTP